MPQEGQLVVCACWEIGAGPAPWSGHIDEETKSCCEVATLKWWALSRNMAQSQHDFTREGTQRKDRESAIALSPLIDVKGMSFNLT